MNRLIIAFVLVLLSCNSKQRIRTHEDIALECADFLKVTFKDLSKQPDYYNRKKIRVSGYFNYGFEEFAIYEIPKSEGETVGIWIDFDKKLGLYEDERYKELAEKKIEVIGTFNANEHGHLSQYIGELTVLCVIDSK
jgi:hypothetical protein